MFQSLAQGTVTSQRASATENHNQCFAIAGLAGRWLGVVLTCSGLSKGTGVHARLQHESTL